ncbi:MAG: hypothetical protein IPI49_18145 [Myxococcales bacterium]|nr:hypothetical protein [Myxococcales bacterium]
MVGQRRVDGKERGGGVLRQEVTGEGVVGPRVLPIAERDPGDHDPGLMHGQLRDRGGLASDAAEVYAKDAMKRALHGICGL